GSAAPVIRTGRTCRTGRAGARPAAWSSTPLRHAQPSPAPRTDSPRQTGPPFPPQEDSATANDVFACSLLYQTRSACQTKVGEAPGGLQAGSRRTSSAAAHKAGAAGTTRGGSSPSMATILAFDSIGGVKIGFRLHQCTFGRR